MNRRAVAFLTQARRTDFEIRRKMTKMQELESCLLPSGISYDRDRVQTSPTDAMSRACSEIFDLEREIKTLQARRAAEIKLIYDTVDKLASKEEQTVLVLYFIGRVPVEKIADDMGYAPSTIYKFRRLGGEHLLDFI